MQSDILCSVSVSASLVCAQVYLWQREFDIKLHICHGQKLSQKGINSVNCQKYAMNLAKIYTFKISVISNISIEMYSYLQYFRFHHMLHVNTIIIPPPPTNEVVGLVVYWFQHVCLSVCLLKNCLYEKWRLVTTRKPGVKAEADQADSP